MVCCTLPCHVCDVFVIPIDLMTMEVVGCHIDCILPWLYNCNEKYDTEPTSAYVCVNT